MHYDELEQYGARLMPVDPSDWCPLAAVAYGDPVRLNGVNLWDHAWSSMKTYIELPHPAFPNETHRFCLYTINVDSANVIFAAGELSPGIWGFYAPASEDAEKGTIG